MLNPIIKKIELPDGKVITLETGKLAKQADGSIILRCGDCSAATCPSHCAMRDLIAPTRRDRRRNTASYPHRK